MFGKLLYSAARFSYTTDRFKFVRKWQTRYEKDSYGKCKCQMCPTCVYRVVFVGSMWMVGHGIMPVTADRVIHRIPFHIRFKLA